MRISRFLLSPGIHSLGLLRLDSALRKAVARHMRRGAPTNRATSTPIAFVKFVKSVVKSASQQRASRSEKELLIPNC